MIVEDGLCREGFLEQARPFGDVIVPFDQCGNRAGFFNHPLIEREDWIGDGCAMRVDQKGTSAIMAFGMSCEVNFLRAIERETQNVCQRIRAMIDG